ncbi:MAG: phosphoglucosamine mutase [Proteobacteria bacterium]|nr:phosphoglucosamine mutase [Pseudomonadota bacterium]
MTISFGTDGIRGTAGAEPFTPSTLKLIGKAFGQAILSNGGKRILIGRDTRESSTWIEVALLEGLCPLGIEVWHAGVVPTGAISCAAAHLEVDMGLMITASHNPWQDNGIKCFGSDGKKPSDSLQAEIEQWINGERNSTHLPQKTCTPLSKRDEVLELWSAFMPHLDLSNFTILLDAAHGAAWQAAPEILEKLGATVLRRGCAPNGRNINNDVGALHPPTELKGCDLAICLDGDGDRVQLVDKNGTLDGDDLLWLLRNTTNGPIVGTVMTNQGLEEVLEGRLLRSKVGDRYVAKLMEENNAHIGGEASGHMLFKEGMPTGDGLYSALKIIECAGKPPYHRFKRWPTNQDSIMFSGNKVPIEHMSTPQAAKASGHRTVVRYSGTESKLRILVEGQESEQWVERIKDEFLTLIKTG